MTYMYAIFQITLKNLRLLFNKKNSLEIKIRKHGYILRILSLFFFHFYIMLNNNCVSYQ